MEWTGGFKDRNAVPLIKIKVRAETSKVRQSREFMVRDNGYFAELRKLVTPLYERRSVKHCPVFSVDGEKAITERGLLYHFAKLMELAEIADFENRNIVPYSFRHYFITQKLVNGLSHRQVADMCGTSITQIERTYYHINIDMMRDAAMADHNMDNDGIVVRVGE